MCKTWVKSFSISPKVMFTRSNFRVKTKWRNEGVCDFFATHTSFQRFGLGISIQCIARRSLWGLCEHVQTRLEHPSHWEVALLSWDFNTEHLNQARQCLTQQNTTQFGEMIEVRYSCTYLCGPAHGDSFPLCLAVNTWAAPKQEIKQTSQWPSRIHILHTSFALKRNQALNEFLLLEKLQNRFQLIAGLRVQFISIRSGVHMANFPQHRATDPKWSK